MKGQAQAENYDTQIAAAQELLKKAQLYTGEINGTLDLPTQIALRHFQMLRNLAVTGKMDERTVAQLHLPPREMVLADREFLKDSLPPIAEAPEESPTSAEAAASPTPAPAPEIELETARKFLKHYLAAASYRKAKPELSYYADSVDFFEHGLLTRDQLTQQLSQGRSRLFVLEKVEQVIPTPATPEAVSVRFSVRVTPLTRSGRKKASGKVETREAILTRTPEGMLKISAIKETQ